MTETPNYHLTQWELTDRVRMEDFNRDNLKIDEALGKISDKIQMASGGMNIGSEAKLRVTGLPFQPKAVILFSNHTYISFGVSQINVTVGFSTTTGSGETFPITWNKDGFEVTTTHKSSTLWYIVFG